MNKEIEHAIEDLKWVMEEPNYRILDREDIKEIYPLAITALEAQQADRWVPLWKKMPDNYSEVYVTTQIGEVYHLFYSNNQFRFGNYSSDLICHSTIDWMPFYIPKPWKEEQSC
ncbi:hypothetical protein [Anaerocolumna chitinilytica]|uniref:DUF551 domain-containing protein n=1 Tax=Anaerocolumna chitinilytica TaxID=1727145 RepID=A0A7M3SAK5_9FIRM|nr:hypothetical protein [Anaerocolumna chitinilytica]BCK01623.1 hypothetical protein bsdcttw_46630 [Anaerocolumna chitinilytica]